MSEPQVITKAKGNFLTWAKRILQTVGIGAIVTTMWIMRETVSTWESGKNWLKGEIHNQVQASSAQDKLYHDNDMKLLEAKQDAKFDKIMVHLEHQSKSIDRVLFKLNQM